jgi:transcriptional regulator GlxA family with amidase domain
VSRKLVPWIARQAVRTRRVAAICTGTFDLAATGLLRNRRVTTHWRYARDLAARYPELRVDADALYLKDGRFYTSAGITAGIDLALALIEEDCGRSGIASGGARAGGVPASCGRPGAVFGAAGVRSQIDRPHCGPQPMDRDQPPPENHHGCALARASLGPRQVSRRFKATFGVTPGDFVESLRMKEARRRLAVSEASIKRVAIYLGYRSSHVFRRHSSATSAFHRAPIASGSAAGREPVVFLVRVRH